jgi:hypothetical protein
VIAQGFVEFATDEFAWRAVRYAADTPSQATAEPRPLGFVLALDETLLLVDQASGEQTLLAPSQAAFVRADSMQQRVSKSEDLVHYLAIELVPSARADDVPNGTVLHVSEPFVPTLGRHGLVLARHLLPPGRVLTVPDSGQRNLLLVIQGSVISRSAAGLAPATLAAEEATAFRGTWEVTMAEDVEADSIEGATIVIASIGSGM